MGLRLIDRRVPSHVATQYITQQNIQRTQQDRLATLNQRLLQKPIGNARRGAMIP
jgi:ATP-dependent Zn protease